MHSRRRQRYLQTQEIGAESLTCWVFWKVSTLAKPDSQSASAVPPQRIALDALMPVVYDELRRLALSFLRRERRDHTLQPTALANEVYLRLADQRHLNAADRNQFFGLAAKMMRRILINYAEAHNAAKRGPALKLSLDDVEAASSYGYKDVNILTLNDALNGLAALDSGKSRIVELRFFGGLTMTEIAAIIGKSRSTVEREWTLARAWLYREIRGQECMAQRESSIDECRTMAED